VPDYLLDACAVLAFLKKEEGADVVMGLIDRAESGEISLCMNAVNLIEVYYDRIRMDGFDQADAIINDIYNLFPVSIIESIDSAIVREAARLKAQGKMSFADTILVATARCTGAVIVTCDHVELEPVERQEHIPFLWIRPHF
jgi:predicted nucleic acid-binding protein